MKRFLSITLLSIYLLFSAGVVVSLHYCGGSLAALKLFVKASCCCDDEESGANDDCCKDEIKTIKIADDQHKEEQIQWVLKSVALEAEAPIFTTIHKQWIYTPTVSNIQQLPRPPDRALLIPAYKLNHAYLFYS